MKHSLATILLLVALPCGKAVAAAQDPRDFLDRVESAIGPDLPAVSEILPGYARPEQRTHSLLVADFTSNQADGLDWGRTVGQLLRWDLLYSPDVRLRMPDYRTHYVDGRSGDVLPPTEVGRSLESIRLIGKRLGIDRALTGHIEITDDRFELSIALRELPSGRVYKKFRSAGSTARLHPTLLAVTRTVLRSLEIGLDDRFAARSSSRSPLSFDQLQLLAEAFTSRGDEDYRRHQRQVIRGLWAQGIRTPIVAGLYLSYMEVGQDIYGYRRRMTDVQAQLPYDAGIELSVARYMVTQNAPDLVSEKVGRLQRLIRNNPRDPSAMIVLCDTFADTGETLSAVALCREALLRWPDNYRVWWSMAWSLLQHGWSVRGNKYWEELTPEAKRLFPKLKELANHAAHRAIALNADNARLWVVKMETIGRYSSDLMDAFFRAAELAPTNRAAYQTALNYSQPQWGGSYSAQRRILDEAQKNGLDPAVLEELRARYIKAPTALERIEAMLDLNLVWVALVIALLVLIYRMRQRSDESSRPSRVPR